MTNKSMISDIPNYVLFSDYFGEATDSDDFLKTLTSLVMFLQHKCGVPDGELKSIVELCHAESREQLLEILDAH